MNEFKQSGGGLKGLLEAVEMYSGKHYSRVDRNLKRSFYVKFVLGQMTLLDNTSTTGDKTADTATAEPTQETSRADRKRDKKAKDKKEARVEKKSKRKSGSNLFSEKRETV